MDDYYIVFMDDYYALWMIKYPLMDDLVVAM
jgi:hypothetical protein